MNRKRFAGSADFTGEYCQLSDNSSHGPMPRRRQLRCHKSAPEIVQSPGQINANGCLFSAAKEASLAGGPRELRVAVSDLGDKYSFVEQRFHFILVASFGRGKRLGEERFKQALPVLTRGLVNNPAPF